MAKEELVFFGDGASETLPAPIIEEGDVSGFLMPFEIFKPTSNKGSLAVQCTWAEERPYTGSLMIAVLAIRFCCIMFVRGEDGENRVGCRRGTDPDGVKRGRPTKDYIKVMSEFGHDLVDWGDSGYECARCPLNKYETADQVPPRLMLADKAPREGGRGKGVNEYWEVYAVPLVHDRHYRGVEVFKADDSFVNGINTQGVIVLRLGARSHHAKIGPVRNALKVPPVIKTTDGPARIAPHNVVFRVTPTIETRDNSLKWGVVDIKPIENAAFSGQGYAEAMAAVVEWIETANASDSDSGPGADVNT